MSIDFVDFSLDQSIVAPVIYGAFRHYTTGKGIALSRDVAGELKHFLSEFNSLVGTTQPPYYRIDAYFDENFLWILEINAAFVDGWGTALNLSRASGVAVDTSGLNFPQHFATKDAVYLPELELLTRELKLFGIDARVTDSPNGAEPVYIYGRVEMHERLHVLPHDGIRLDNKINLGLLSRRWEGNRVKIPRHYINRFQLWEEIPQEAVLKFCDKGGDACKSARQSVIFQKPSGKAPFLRKCYAEEVLLAQNFVRPMKQGKDNCQLVILVIGNEPITGYVQYSQRQIINDDSTHGPLRVD